MFGNVLLIVNPAAKSGKAKQVLINIEDRLKHLVAGTKGHLCEIIETSFPLDAMIAAKELGDQFDTIFVLGGDGLIHEVANGIMAIPQEDRPALGVLPAGQGNDFARSLNLPLDPVKVLDHMSELEIKTIDVGKVNDSYFIQTLSFGVDAAIALETMERRRHTKQTGTILYLESGFNQIKNHLDIIHASVTIDGDTTGNLGFYTFAIQNGSTYGGGFNICPFASLDDGKFNVCYATPPLSRLAAVKVFLKAKEGMHLNDEHMHFCTGKEFKLIFDEMPPAQTDGEPISAYEFNVSVLPAQIKVLTF